MLQISGVTSFNVNLTLILQGHYVPKISYYTQTNVSTSEANAVSVSVSVADAVLAEGGEQVVVGSSLDEDPRLVLEPPHAQRFLVPNQPLLHPLHALRGHHLGGLHVPLPRPDDRPDRGTWWLANLTEDDGGA